MTQYYYRLVNVFAESTFGGNPLCVFEDARGLSSDTMQALALQFNLSETTFILPSSTATARVRIFTPTFEMVFAGHPTLGSAHVVRELCSAGPKDLRLDGYRGELRAEGNLLLDQFQFMHQVGFDSFEVNERFALQQWQAASKQMSLAYQRGLYRTSGEREVWSQRHQGFAPWEEQPHAG